MKKFLLGTVAVIAVGMTVPALAADLGARGYTKAPPYVAQAYNYWTGFYIGGHLGGAFSSDNNFNGLVSGSNNDGRFLGGVQVGADYQFAQNWVVGIEGQYSWLGNNNSVIFPGGFIYTNNQRAIASVTGRVGFAWGPALLYAKGGYAFSDNSESLSLLGTPVAFTLDSGHRDGYTVGAGLEYMFAPNWSAKIEYQYYNFGDTRFVTPTALAPLGSFTNDDHTVKVGLNYRINWGNLAPARY
ncbi:MAG TPA: outer membrane protein [Bradyrhizobium sp.]|jgi:outer membrane immunogenic protein|nr:outer membrane protein [Bradyrhizobium sp.]